MQEAFVKFNGYSILRLELVKNDMNKQSNNVGEMELNSNVFQNKKRKNSYKVVLEIVTSSNVYDIHIAIEGYFEFDSNMSNEAIDTFLGINANTILYPYCRSIISMMSSLDGNSAVVLPVINFAEEK